MYCDRPLNSSNELDDLDTIWWNKYSNTIELIWAQSSVIRNCLRGFYVKKINKFFNNKTNNKILELACGSGWVGRMIAGKGLYIEGIDSSISQINIATKEAQLANLENYCNYKVANVSELKDEYDGILIHSFLYILSQNELNDFFQKLSKFKKNTKVYIHEAVYMDTIPPKTIYQKIMYRITHSFLKLADYFINYVKRLIEQEGQKNQELVSSLNEIEILAQKNNTVLSPKGVPFKEQEIISYLKKYFFIDNYYFVNKFDLIIAQHLMIYNIPNPPWQYKTIFFAIARFLDELYFNFNLYRYTYRTPYCFMCFELRLK